MKKITKDQKIKALESLHTKTMNFIQGVFRAEIDNEFYMYIIDEKLDVDKKEDLEKMYSFMKETIDAFVSNYTYIATSVFTNEDYAKKFVDHINNDYYNNWVKASKKVLTQLKKVLNGKKNNIR